MFKLNSSVYREILLIGDTSVYVVGMTEGSVSKRDFFYKDVLCTLISLIGGEEFIDAVTESPYGYIICKNSFIFCF